jgi:hypothetical protein
MQGAIAPMVIVLRNGRVTEFRDPVTMRVKQALLRFHGNPRRARVYIPFIAILKLPFKFYRSWSSQQAGKRRAHDPPKRGRFGDQITRSPMGARSDAKPDFTLADRAPDNGTFLQLDGSRARKKARQKSKRRCQMFQGHLDLDAATPVEASAIPDVLFERGLYWASGRSGVVNLVAAHKWFNLAALKGRADAIELRREVAELMSEVEIAMAQREARAWMTTQ